ncbi:MAG: hypothetical protein JSR41_21755 [Proteobacteria bacterium]|nr:hypothetical protein [Pseudomonadota bacterium]
MKNVRAFGLLLFVGLVSAGFVEAGMQHESTASATAVTHRVQANLGPGCHVSVTVPVSEVPGLWGNAEEGWGGMGVRPVPKQWHSSISSLGFSLSCRDKDDPKNPLPSGIYDQGSKTWIKDVPTLRRELAKSSDYSDPKFLAQTVATIRTYDIKTPNAQGWADTGDDLTGEDEKRRRTMSFCVYHANKALCGLGNVAYLHDGRKGDLTSEALKIIRSIEFLD